MAKAQRPKQSSKKASKKTAKVGKRPFRRALTIGATKILPGQVRDIRLPISDTYIGRTMTLPIHVVRAEKPGPVVFIVAAVHGDEINGTGILHELMYKQRVQLTRGSLICAPVVNIFGFETRVRYMPDRRDLNRSFPGSARGSMASRVASIVFREIIKKCDYGIDLHSAAVHRVNFPNVRADMSRKDVAALARAFGCEIIVNGGGPDGSLRRSACEAGCPTIVLESGQVGRIEPFAMDGGLRGIRNVLQHLGMIDEPAEVAPAQVEIHKTKWVRAEVGGLLRFHFAPGDVVEGGQPLATNESVFGKARTTLIAPADAVVLSMTTHPAVKPGEPVCQLGLLSAAELKRFRKSTQEGAAEGLFQRARRDLSTSIVVSPLPSRKAAPRRGKGTYIA